MKTKICFFLSLIIVCLSACSDDSDTVTTISTSDLTVNFDENPIDNQEIGTISGQTNQGTVSFSITSQTPDGTFSIEATTGKLSVFNKDLFDFEVNPVIVGVVEVSNAEVSELSKVTINLNDIEEDVFNGNVTLTTQEEIDAFGANNYKIINGNLKIDENQTVKNIVFLDPLSSLIEISGTLEINNMFNLLDIPGFNNLTSVGGIIITNNWGILDMNSFLNITDCNGSITITNNGSLGSFCGIRPLLQSGNFSDTYTVSNNFYNPTQQNIIDGMCEDF